MGRRVRRPCNHPRHEACVSYAQPCKAMDAKLWVDDRKFILSRRASSRWVLRLPTPEIEAGDNHTLVPHEPFVAINSGSRAPSILACGHLSDSESRLTMAEAGPTHWGGDFK
jgi:hypothetical protein